MTLMSITSSVCRYAMQNHRFRSILRLQAHPFNCIASGFFASSADALFQILRLSILRLQLSLFPIDRSSINENSSLQLAFVFQSQSEKKMKEKQGNLKEIQQAVINSMNKTNREYLAQWNRSTGTFPKFKTDRI